jgi:ubiquinone/menaquinone biosynthesis C-methylase UbiE
MINEDDYLIYIKKNKKLTNMEKEYYINISKNKNKIDYKIRNKIYSLYIISDKFQKYRLQMVFNHFTNNQINIINEDDNYFINIIKKNINSNYINKWAYSIEQICRKFRKINKNKNIKYLDIGCGSGSKTKLFYKYLDIPKNNVYCTDIESWGPYKKYKNIDFNFKLIKNNKLNYDDNTFDIITCILTLHHIEKLNEFILEIHRILKKNGYLILIEHSIESDYDTYIINIQHMLYSALYDKRDDYLENPDYIQCYNMYEWNYILKKYNLKMKYQNILPKENIFSYEYDNIYYSIFIKKN